MTDDKNVCLTEERIREIIREEVWKILVELGERKLREIEQEQKFVNSFRRNSL